MDASARKKKFKKMEDDMEAERIRIEKRNSLVLHPRTEEGMDG